jgi:hypothetical protein
MCRARLLAPRTKRRSLPRWNDHLLPAPFFADDVFIASGHQTVPGLRRAKLGQALLEQDPVPKFGPWYGMGAPFRGEGIVEECRMGGRAMGEILKVVHGIANGGIETGKPVAKLRTAR